VRYETGPTQCLRGAEPLCDGANGEGQKSATCSVGRAGGV
jgi:hypothetical protein